MAGTTLIFITGGVRSGKSSFAEHLATREAESIHGSLHYIATAKKYSEEMNRRIARHQSDREASGFAWTTWEKETEMKELAPSYQHNDVVLLDCLTVLLSNELDVHFNKRGETEILTDIWSGVEQIASRCHQLVVVSNELLYEPYDSDAFMMTYYRLMGKLHQRLVKYAEKAYVVEAGMPLIMKGGEA